MPYKDPAKQREYQRNRLRLKRLTTGRCYRVLRKNTLLARVREIKAKFGCVRCGEKDVRCLSFHHERDKYAEISDMVSRGLSWVRIMAEIEKCILLCANCHCKEHIRLEIGPQLTIDDGYARVV